MVTTKDKAEYTAWKDDFKPLPKYGHLSELDPDFAQMKSAVDANIEQLWEPSLSFEDFCAMWAAPPAPVPGSPVEGEDVLTETRKIPMRDGAEIEVKIYSAKDKKPGSALMLRYHGGGWVVGGHNTEHNESLIIAGRTNTVLVSVDYRM